MNEELNQRKNMNIININDEIHQKYFVGFCPFIQLKLNLVCLNNSTSSYFHQAYLIVYLNKISKNYVNNFVYESELLERVM